jgi:hypothetical protein
VLAGSEAALTARVEELERATTLLQRAQDLAGLATFRIDLDLREITLSPELSGMYRLGRHEIVLPLADYRARFYLPDDLAPKTIDAEHAYQRGTDLLSTTRVVRADGSIIWVRSTSRVVHDPDGTSHVLGVVQDATDQVWSPDRDRLLATLVESSDDAMITDRRCRVRRRRGRRSAGCGQPAHLATSISSSSPRSWATSRGLVR